MPSRSRRWPKKGNVTISFEIDGGSCAPLARQTTVTPLSRHPSLSTAFVYGEGSLTKALPLYRNLKPRRHYVSPRETQANAYIIANKKQHMTVVQRV